MSCASHGEHAHRISSSTVQDGPYACCLPKLSEREHHAGRAYASAQLELLRTKACRERSDSNNKWFAGVWKGLAGADLLSQTLKGCQTPIPALNNKKHPALLEEAETACLPAAITHSSPARVWAPGAGWPPRPHHRCAPGTHQCSGHPAWQTSHHPTRTHQLQCCHVTCTVPHACCTLLHGAASRQCMAPHGSSPTPRPLPQRRTVAVCRACPRCVRAVAPCLCAARFRSCGPFVA